MSKIQSTALICVLALGLYPTQPVQAQPIGQILAEDSLMQSFAQLNMGMTTAEVLALMKRDPARTEVTNHLGLEFQRLIWTQWTNGKTFEVILVAGRLVSKASTNKNFIIG